MNGLVREVCDSLAETIRERGLTLDIRESPFDPTVQADRNQVIRILVNLVSNAYRYTLAGGQITVSVEALDQYVLVQVADTGIGIASEDHERIFERFYRADHDVVRSQEGTGLGLGIVRSLVEMHGGELWLESELDKGSTFSFTLPVGR
jgi:signal transduction histidine kinase